jgi:hypothetical protein
MNIIDGSRNECRRKWSRFTAAFFPGMDEQNHKKASGHDWRTGVGSNPVLPIVQQDRV